MTLFDSTPSVFRLTFLVFGYVRTLDPWTRTACILPCAVVTRERSRLRGNESLGVITLYIDCTSDIIVALLDLVLNISTVGAAV